MKRKLIGALLCVSMVAATLVGCGNTAGSTESSDGGSTVTESSAKGGSVYWLNFKPEADEALQQIASDYTAETGVPVKVVTAASGNYESTLTAEMDKSNVPTLATGGQPFNWQADGTVVKTTEMLALNIYNTFYGQSSTARGVAQAKAVLFFVLVAAISLIQLSATKDKEVQ